MAVLLPPSANVPWDPAAIRRAIESAPRSDPDVLVEYMKQLVLFLDRMYNDIYSAANQLDKDLQALKTRYDAHVAHPPPA